MKKFLIGAAVAAAATLSAGNASACTLGGTPFTVGGCTLTTFVETYVPANIASFSTGSSTWTGLYAVSGIFHKWTTTITKTSNTVFDVAGTGTATVLATKVTTPTTASYSVPFGDAATGLAGLAVVGAFLAARRRAVKTA